jgi:hypothetical protein
MQKVDLYDGDFNQMFDLKLTVMPTIFNILIFPTLLKETLLLINTAMVALPLPAQAVVERWHKK